MSSFTKSRFDGLSLRCLVTETLARHASHDGGIRQEYPMLTCRKSRIFALTPLQTSTTTATRVLWGRGVPDSAPAQQYQNGVDFREAKLRRPDPSEHTAAATQKTGIARPEQKRQRQHPLKLSKPATKQPRALLQHTRNPRRPLRANITPAGAIMGGRH